MNTRYIGFILQTIIFLMYAGMSLAQDSADWESFPSLSNVNDVAALDGFIYGACTNGMFRYDIEEREYKLYYSGHGLDKSSIRTIVAAKGILYLGFEKDGLVLFDPVTEEFTDILFPEYVNQTDPQKTIAVNDIFVYDENILYVAHENGIDMLDLETEEIRTFGKLSTRIRQDTPVRRIYVIDQTIWACTTEGLAWADINKPNLESENEWESVGFGTGITAIIPYITDDDTLLFVGTTGKGIKIYDPKTRIGEDTDVIEGTITDFEKLSENIYATVKDTRNKEGFYKLAGNTWFPRKKYTDLNAAVAYDNYIYIGAAYDGLLCVAQSGYWGIPAMNLPKAGSIRHIDITQDGVIWTATADRDAEAHTFLQKYHDGEWIYYDVAEGDGIPSEWTTSVITSSHGPVWASTWGDGVYVIYDNGTLDKDDDLFFQVDEQREIIIEYDEGKKFYVCPELIEDKNGNIWMAGYSRGAYVLEGDLPLADYKHQRFDMFDNSSSEFVMHVTPDDDGWVWLGMLETGVYGIYVGDDPFDREDDILRHVAISEGLLGDSGEAIHPDFNGDVWVGSEGGLNLIEKKSGYTLDVSNKNTLLGGEVSSVQSIEVDPYNTKWIGTTKGLVRINANNEYVSTYTTDNSAILSDVILSLKYDEANDYLLIGTDTGLSRLQVVKNGGGDNHASSFHMYPNPFEIWGYNSQATFNNLKSGKPVRIYTFNGELIKEIEPGNTGSGSVAEAVWNGRNFKNEFVSSGVYFFTGVDQNGEDFREKMVVIRR